MRLAETRVAETRVAETRFAEMRVAEMRVAEMKPAETRLVKAKVAKVELTKTKVVNVVMPITLGMKLVDANTFQPAIKYAFASTVSNNLLSYNKRARKQITEPMQMVKKFSLFVSWRSYRIC